MKKKLVRLGFAFFPTSCVVCGKFIWFKFAYIMPWYYREAYNYGYEHNEVHCVSCHKNPCEICNRFLR